MMHMVMIKNCIDKILMPENQPFWIITYVLQYVLS